MELMKTLEKKRYGTGESGFKRASKGGERKKWGMVGERVVRVDDGTEWGKGGRGWER